jgi:hypothetical protein
MNRPSAPQRWTQRPESRTASLNGRRICRRVRGGKFLRRSRGSGHQFRAAWRIRQRSWRCFRLCRFSCLSLGNRWFGFAFAFFRFFRLGKVRSFGLMRDAPVGRLRRPAKRRTGSRQPLPQYNGNVLIDRAGMRFLLLHAQFGQQIENNAGLHFKLPRQLVDSDFLHRRDC